MVDPDALCRVPVGSSGCLACYLLPQVSQRRMRGRCGVSGCFWRGESVLLSGFFESKEVCRRPPRLQEVGLQAGSAALCQRRPGPGWGAPGPPLPSIGSVPRPRRPGKRPDRRCIPGPAWEPAPLSRMREVALPEHRLYPKNLQTGSWSLC